MKEAKLLTRTPSDGPPLRWTNFFERATSTRLRKTQTQSGGGLSDRRELAKRLTPLIRRDPPLPEASFGYALFFFDAVSRVGRHEVTREHL